MEYDTGRLPYADSSSELLELLSKVGCYVDLAIVAVLPRKYLKVESFLKKVLTRLLLGFQLRKQGDAFQQWLEKDWALFYSIDEAPAPAPSPAPAPAPYGFCTPAPAPAPAPADALTTVRVSTQITLDGVVAAFNYDGGQQAAFALAVLDSAIHFDDITDIEARREAGWPPARPVPGVVSFTGISQIYDVDNPEDIAAEALTRSLDSLTEALTDGSFLTSLQGHPAFAVIKVDLDATLPLEATVAYDVYIPPAPAPAPALSLIHI